MDDYEEYFESINLYDNSYYDLIDMTCNIMEEFIYNSPLLISEENFEDTFQDNISQILYSSIYDIFPDISEEYIDIIIYKIISESSKIIYSHIIPKRYYKYTFIRSKPNISKIQEKINIIRNIPQPEQRTTEWYMFRHNLITASNAYKCLENEKKINEIIFEKCQPFKIKDDSSVIVNTETPFHWGQKYEPISVMIYENKYNCKVEDFGCIQHPNFIFLGASPDGIVVNNDSDRFGRMLEIKNPISRKITSIPKKMYWIQMQLQMEVCNLNECDFLETKFVEYQNAHEFFKDGSFQRTHDKKQKGIILQFNVDKKNIYEYAPLNINEQQFTIWENEQIQKHSPTNYLNTIYWKLEQYSCSLVLRNKLWFKEAILQMEKVWNIVLEERISGYQHRAPQKKIKKPTSQEKCLLNVKQLLLQDNNSISDLSDDCDSKSQPKSSSQTSINEYIRIRTQSFDESKISL